MASSHTVQLSVSSSSPYLEGVVYTGGGVVTPGELLNLGSDGTYSNVFSGAVWGTNGVGSPIIAVENLPEGKHIDDTYAEGEKLYMRYLRPGDVGWLWLDTGNTAVIGSFLTVTDAGLVEVKADLSVNIYFFGLALEAVTTTTSTARIKVQIK